MIQLKVYSDKNRTDQYFLDLYKTSPIKVSLAIEDITDTSTSSSFSKAFRVPATQANDEFFKTAFLVNGLDFDVTQKKPAEILVDGNEFRRGHVRLQKVFRNETQGLTDYELLFLGETRDFASAIGDTPMCDLVIPDITHNFSKDNIKLSWEAYPDTPGASGTTGLVNGNVVYPLIDFGNNYDDDGCTVETRIATHNIHGQACNSNFYFTHNASDGVDVSRFKPMVRAKKIWDQIFYDAGFTYTSNFLGEMGDNIDTGIFKQLYVSAFGNDAAITVDATLGSQNNFRAYGDNNSEGGCDDTAKFPDEAEDQGNNYDPVTSYYTLPEEGDYTFQSRIFGEATSGGGTGEDRNASFYTVFQHSPDGGTSWLSLPSPSLCREYGYIDNQTTVNVTAAGQPGPSVGDLIRVRVECCNDGDSRFRSVHFFCTQSPSVGFNPTTFFDCEYKQIDFIKDVLTSFRLVMQPNPNRDRDFIIEPWINFHLRGEILDWSSKLVNDKDFQIEPLFFTQQNEIDFNLEEDADLVADYHRKVYKENYGYLEFDANNELLKGKRDIAVNYAPTPLTTIDGEPSDSAWVIPRLCTNEAEADGNQFLPIKAKTRFLFYNGTKVTHPTNPIEWYFRNDNNGIGYYPVVSPISGQAIGTPNPENTILQWFKDVTYYIPTATTQWQGQSMYDIYWSDYIQSLYASFARKVTAYFKLDYLDIYDFTFDKVIFVNGNYYSVNKISDVPIGDEALVKVELLRALSYSPFTTPIDTGMQLAQEYNTAADACQGSGADQTVTYVGLLGVGTTLQGFSGVQGNNGFFKIVTNVEEPQYVDYVIGVNDDDEVISIQNICP